MRGPCYCSGPQPGHTLCPCAERRESARDCELRRLRTENETLMRRLSAGPIRSMNVSARLARIRELLSGPY